MIDFGSSALCGTQCSSIGLSGVTLDGQGQAVNGVVNNNAGELSYVRDTTIKCVEGAGSTGAGLYIGSGANNSGPYRDLWIFAGGTGVCSQGNANTNTACVRIAGASTRGVHGITCTANGTPYAGIYLDGSNNTIEDAHFEGVVDGIAVGDSGPAASNVVLNITGGGGGSTSGPIDNIVHICSSTSTATPCSTSSGPVTDLSLLSIAGNQAQYHAVYMVVDNVTGTSIPAPAWPGQGFVGLYALGEPIGSGYSRFVTNTVASSTSVTPTWGVGTTVPGSTCTDQNGSLFSNTSGTNGGLNTLFVCLGGTWANIK